MTRPQLWPGSLAGRTLLLLFTTALLIYASGIVAYRVAAEQAAEGSRIAQIADRLRTTMDTVGDLPPGDRAAAARTLSSPRFRASWSTVPMIGVTGKTSSSLRNLRRRLIHLVPELANRQVYLHWGPYPLPAAHSVLLGTVQLTDTSYLTFSAPMVSTAIPPLPAMLWVVSIIFLSIIVAAIFVLYAINAPLRRLAEAADSYGSGRPMLLPERGPREIVRVERAFNSLQRRVQRLIADRTQALAAVSHDLRTPVARMRLRCGWLADTAMQLECDRDLSEMEAMIESTLAYLRGDDDAEQARLTDVASMLTTLVDVANDGGSEATLSGPRHAVLPLRALSIKRAMANLIGNAVTYGGCARVSLEQTREGLRITIDDSGPGIPEADLLTVFEPFRRLETSRNRASGGVGLGLTIARQAVEREGGKIRLMNRPEGGLRAQISLPAHAESSRGGD